MSRFSNFRNVLIKDEKNSPLNGSIFLDEFIVNFENGYINNWINKEIDDDIQPAISCIDGHIEFWENGEINNNNGPAVISVSDNKIEFWENGTNTQTEKNPSYCNEKYHQYKKNRYYELGHQAEIKFASYLDNNKIPFIHLDQPTDDLYSAVFKNNNIKRPDYLIFINKKPLFIDVKATGCYRLKKTDLMRLKKLKDEYFIDILFAVTNINKPVFNDFSFVTLDNIYNYSNIIENNITNYDWNTYPVPAKLLSKEMIFDNIENDVLEKIFRAEKYQKKYHYSDILHEFLNDNKYKIGKTKHG